MASDPNQLHFRLDDELMRLLDRYADYIKKTLGITMSRSDAARSLIKHGLENGLVGFQQWKGVKR